MANNVAVSITADVADLQVKRALMSSELKAATKDLNDFAKQARQGGMTEELRAGMVQAAEAAAKARAQIALVDAEVRKLTADSSGGGAFGAIGKGLESVKAGAESLSALRATVSGFGEALLAAFAVEGVAEWAKRMGEAGEKTEHTAQILGTSVATVQQLGGAFTLMGVDTERGVTGIERLDKAFATAREGTNKQSEAFAELDVSTTQNYTQMQLLGAVMDGFARQADGPAKAAEAMALFGRAGAQLIPFLNLGSAGLAKLNEVTSQYGVVNEDAVAKSALLGESFNENAVAMGGFGNVMAQEFAPAMTVVVQGVNSLIASWIASYKAGGDVKTILGIIGDAMETLIVIAGGLGLAIDETFKVCVLAVNTFKDDWKLVVDTAKGEAAGLEDEFVTLGRVIYDALTNNIIAAGQDMKAGEDKMVADVVAATAKIRADAAAIAKDAAPEWDKMKADGEAYMNWANSLHDGKAKPAPVKPTGEGGDGDTSADMAKTKKAADDRVAVWTAALHAEEVASNDFFTDQTARELAFWQSKVAATTVGSKAWLEVQSKIYDAQKTLAHQAYDAHIATLNDQIEADKGSWAKEQSDLQAKLAYIKSTLGTENAQYNEAHKALEDAEREHQKAMVDAARSAAQEQIAELKANLKSMEEARKADAQAAEEQINAQAKYAGPLGQVEAAQKIAAIRAQQRAADLAAAATTYAAEDDLRQGDIAREITADGTKLQGYQKALEAKSQADNAYYAAKRAKEEQDIAQQVADQQKIVNAWHSAIDPMVQSTGQNIVKLAEGTETWGQALQHVEGGVINMVASALEKMVENWIVQTITGAAQTKTVNATTALSYAGMAGAAGVASMAAAPFPYDTGAFAFGGEMYAAAAAFAGASLDVGTNFVPTDMIAQIHAGERVIPAGENSQMMALMAAGAGGGTGGGNTFHVGGHTININGADDPRAVAAQVRKVISDSPSHVADAFNRAVKGNWSSKHASPFKGG